MDRQTQSVRISWIGWTRAMVAAALLLPGGAWARAQAPALVGALGGSFAVEGIPNEGGSSASFAVLWPVVSGFSFGIAVHGDDAGALVDSLRDARGVGLPNGKVEQLHRAAWGVSWRGDLMLPDGFGSRRGGALRWLPFGREPYVSATWGYYRVADDLRGRSIGKLGSPGFSLAAGWRYPLGRHLHLGPSVRVHRLFNDRMGRLVSAGLECAWR
jgi:hypothetical protein